MRRALARSAAILLLVSSSTFGAEVPLTLEDAVRLALEQNRRLAVARTTEETAAEGVKEARAAFFPNLSLEAGYVRLDEAPYIPASTFRTLLEGLRRPFEDLVAGGVLDPASLVALQGGPNRITVGSEDNYNVGLHIRQPLFTGHALRGGLAAARHRHEAERWNLRREEDGARFTATAAYLELVKSDALRRAADDAVRRVEAHVNDLEGMMEEGVILESDLLRGRVELSRARLAASHADHETRLASVRLAHEIGMEPGETPAPRDTLGPVEDAGADLEDLREAALGRRPDRKALEEARSAGDEMVRIRRGRFLPDLFLIGSYDWKRPDREYRDEFYDSWTVGLALDWTLFDGGARRSRSAAARLDERRLGELLAAQADAIALEVEQVFLARDEARDALLLTEEQLGLATEHERVVRESFRAGAATNTDLLDAESMLTTAREDRIRALADLHLAEARLAYAVGGGEEGGGR